MKIFDFFRRKKERKPVVLKDLTTFNLCRVRVSKRDDDGDLHDAAELYVIAESSDDANLQIRRLLEQCGGASWTTAPVAVQIDDVAETAPPSRRFRVGLGNPDDVRSNFTRAPCLESRSPRS
ncbi:MAG: hypothetical protein IJZ10_06710 [Thermoguttaceae bacterium]|nr:hypothetical protein [Thermoguttaceae bacterium]